MTVIFRKNRAENPASSRPPPPPPPSSQSITSWNDPRDFEEFTVITHPPRSGTTSADLLKTPFEDDSKTTAASSSSLAGTSRAEPRPPPASTSSVAASTPVSTIAADEDEDKEVVERLVDDDRERKTDGSDERRNKNGDDDRDTARDLPPPSLLALPGEFLPLIARHLPYPDLLALRHTHPRFLHTPLIRSSKPLKIAWLLERASSDLPIPMHTKLRLDTDADFNRNPEVRAIMRAHRRHAECGSGPGGCRVVAGETCGGRKVVWRWGWGGRSVCRGDSDFDGSSSSASADRKMGGADSMRAGTSTTSAPTTQRDKAHASSVPARPDGAWTSTAARATASFPYRYEVVRYAGESHADAAWRTALVMSGELARASRRRKALSGGLALTTLLLLLGRPVAALLVVAWCGAQVYSMRFYESG